MVSEGFAALILRHKITRWMGMRCLFKLKIQQRTSFLAILIDLPIHSIQNPTSQWQMKSLAASISIHQTAGRDELLPSYNVATLVFILANHYSRVLAIYHYIAPSHPFSTYIPYFGILHEAPYIPSIFQLQWRPLSCCAAGARIIGLIFSLFDIPLHIFSSLPFSLSEPQRGTVNISRNYSPSSPQERQMINGFIWRTGRAAENFRHRFRNMSSATE